MIHWAGSEGKQDAVVEALFRGYFLEGANIGDAAILAETAGSCGMDSAAIGANLAGDIDRAAIAEAAHQASKKGISGVPCFVVDSQYVISGAQGPEHFIQLFDALAAQAQTET